MRPLYLFDLRKTYGETDIGTYKPIGFPSPLQYKTLHLVLTKLINNLRLPHGWYNSTFNA